MENASCLNNHQLYKVHVYGIAIEDSRMGQKMQSQFSNSTTPFPTNKKKTTCFYHWLWHCSDLGLTWFGKENWHPGQIKKRTILDNPQKSSAQAAAGHRAYHSFWSLISRHELCCQDYDITACGNYRDSAGLFGCLRMGLDCFQFYEPLPAVISISKLYSTCLVLLG